MNEIKIPFKKFLDEHSFRCPVCNKKIHVRSLSVDIVKEYVCGQKDKIYFGYFTCWEDYENANGNHHLSSNFPSSIQPSNELSERRTTVYLLREKPIDKLAERLNNE